MLQQIQLKVKAADGQKLHTNWGYSLYGILCRHTDSDYIAELHSCNETPISQYLEVLPGYQEGIWHIHLLGEEAIHFFGETIQNNNSFPAEHHGTILQIVEKHIAAPISEHDFCMQYLTMGEAVRTHELEFITPVGFKSQEQYQIFPTVELMLKSLWRNWQSFSRELQLDGEDVRDQLIQYTQIRDYQLKSVRYPLKGNKIPACKGKVILQVHGPEPLARIVSMLLAFGEYSGIGMKTALGMGGCRIVHREK